MSPRSRALTPVPVNVALVGNRVVVDVAVKTRRVGPRVTWTVSSYKGHGGRHTGRVQSDDEGREGAMRLQPKQLRRLPAKHQKPGERHGADPPSAPEGTNTAHALSTDIWLQNRKILNR